MNKKIYQMFLKKYVFHQKRYFNLVCLVTIIQSGATMCIPLTYRGLLDHAFPRRDVVYFAYMVLVMILCYLAAILLNVAKDYLLAKISEGLCQELRKELNQKISVMEYSYFDNHSVSEIISKYNKEIDTIKQNCGYMLIKTLSNIVTFIMAATLIIIMEWKILFVTLTLLVLYILNNRYWGMKVKALFEKSMECNEEAIGSITETYKNVLITKIYSAHEYVNKKFEDVYKKQYETSMSLELTYSINMNSGGLLTYLLSGMIWVIGGIGIFAGTLTIGTVTALVNYQNMLVSPMAFFSEFNNSYQSTIVSMKRLLSVLGYEEEKNDGVKLEEGAIDKIRFLDVTFGYTEDIKVLEHINLEIPRGKITAFIGGSGCGKSSLVKMILRLYQPICGEILLDATPIKDISVTSLRNRISFVAQDSLFYKGSIVENIFMGGSIDQSRLIEYSKLLDLYEEITNLPGQWESELNSGNSNLSGGQKKRLDVLRALLKESDIIIFDESTASIDIERRKKLFQILDRIKENKIIIFITHNVEECVHFDQIFAVKNKGVHPVTIQNLAEAY